MLDTAREPIATTVSACAASGRTRSASRPRSSCRSSSGLPEVVRWQARVNSGDTGSPSRRPTIRVVASGESGAGRTTTAIGSSASSASSSSSSCCSPVRIVPTTSTGTSSSRRTR
jgi:hypothetical protein